VTHDPHRKRAATARRARREFITSPDEPVFLDDPPEPHDEHEPTPWDNTVTMYRKMLPAPVMQPNDPRAWTDATTLREQLRDQPMPTTADVEQANTALESWLTRRQWKYAPAFTPRAAPANISPYPHRPQPPILVNWSPRAYAGLRGLSGNAAEMFTEIAGAIQAARESTPW